MVRATGIRVWTYASSFIRWLIEYSSNYSRGTIISDKKIYSRKVYGYCTIEADCERKKSAYIYIWL